MRFEEQKLLVLRQQIHDSIERVRLSIEAAKTLFQTRQQNSKAVFHQAPPEQRPSAKTA